MCVCINIDYLKNTMDDRIMSELVIFIFFFSLCIFYNFYTAHIFFIRKKLFKKKNLLYSNTIFTVQLEFTSDIVNKITLYILNITGQNKLFHI